MFLFEQRSDTRLISIESYFISRIKGGDAIHPLAGQNCDFIGDDENDTGDCYERHLDHRNSDDPFPGLPDGHSSLPVSADDILFPVVQSVAGRLESGGRQHDGQQADHGLLPVE